MRKHKIYDYDAAMDGADAAHKWLTAHGEVAEADDYARRLSAIRRAYTDAATGDRGTAYRAKRRSVEYVVIARAASATWAVRS